MRWRGIWKLKNTPKVHSLMTRSSWEGSRQSSSSAMTPFTNETMIQPYCVVWIRSKRKGSWQMLHEGTFGTHSSGHTMTKKILRAGYFWSTMEADCYQHSRTCHKFQIYVDKVHIPPVPDRKSTRLNSSHANISYAVFCLKKTKDGSIFWCNE